jgi:acid phosphatase (class A)
MSTRRRANHKKRLPIMTRRFVPFFTILVLVVAGLATPLGARDVQSRRFLPANQVDMAALVPPPPAVGSPAFKEQMTVVLWLQRTRTPAQIEFVREELDVARFASLLGGDLLEVDGIGLKRMIDSAIDEVRAEYDALKGKYDLPRPFVVNDAVHPVTYNRPVASYPSGHATRAVVHARLLAEIFPKRREALMELAHQIGYGRVIAGVHYPVDVVAGFRLGSAFADAIIAQPAFVEAVKHIRGVATAAGGQ